VVPSTKTQWVGLPTRCGPRAAGKRKAIGFAERLAATLYELDRIELFRQLGFKESMQHLGETR
jgi:hypothetical protein